MILVELKFIHYSPKDSEEGLKELIVTNDREQILNYVDKEIYELFFKSCSE